MTRVVHPGSRILIFYPFRIPDKSQNAPEPGSGSATLPKCFTGTYTVKGLKSARLRKNF
jgi:hypothetical protein